MYEKANITGKFTGRRRINPIINIPDHEVF